MRTSTTCTEARRVPANRPAWNVRMIRRMHLASGARISVRFKVRLYREGVSNLVWSLRRCRQSAPTHRAIGASSHARRFVRRTHPTFRRHHGGASSPSEPEWSGEIPGTMPMLNDKTSKANGAFWLRTRQGTNQRPRRAPSSSPGGRSSASPHSTLPPAFNDARSFRFLVPIPDGIPGFPTGENQVETAIVIKVDGLQVVRLLLVRGVDVVGGE